MLFTHSPNTSMDSSEVIFSLFPPEKGGFAENQSRCITYINLYLFIVEGIAFSLIKLITVPTG